MMPNALFVSLLGIPVALGLHAEWRRHRRAIQAIPIRIHVNGTRGKSSVTRLIASILRENGIRTVAKTTGTAARFILPDGSEEPIPRDGLPNIDELIRSMDRAARLGAEAVVFECMAVDPDLQRVAEERVVQPTLTVVTNARLDHTDLQGSTEDEVARAFPVRPGGTLLTADPLVARMQEPRLRASGGSLHIASGRDVGAEEIRALTYLEHPDNVAISLEAARLLGIERGAAVEALRHTLPDPGVASVIDLLDPSGPWTLFNLFAANDPESTFLALDAAEARYGRLEEPVLLFVARRDRTARSAEFASAFAEHRERFAKFVVWGERTGAVVRRARRSGLGQEELLDAGRRSPAALTDLLVASLERDRTVVGVGNIVGPAHRWLEYLAETRVGPAGSGDASGSDAVGRG